MQTKKKYLITNVVYGPLYLKIFLNHHLRSILDDTNLPAIKDRFESIEYRIFTDEETKPKLDADPQMKRLQAYCNVKIQVFEWHREDHSKYEMRYSVLMDVFKASVDLALKESFDYVTAWVADLVVAREFFPRVMDQMAKDHGAVMVLPMRTAFESMAPFLNQSNRALKDMELFELGYRNLHPLFTSADWNSPRFSKLPFFLLWSNPRGIMARTFSWTPIVFEPNAKMLEGRGMIDGEVPELCRNPYWCTDWIEAPVAGVEPLFCYYPTFVNFRANVRTLKTWTRQAMHPSQIAFAKKCLYYPSKAIVKMNKWTKLKSNMVIKRLQ